MKRMVEVNSSWRNEERRAPLTHLGMKILRKIRFFIVIIGFLFQSSCNSTFPENHGIIESKLYLSKSEKQPLIVAFGGSEGGMIYTQESTREFRDKILSNGYAFLSIGYFGTENTPSKIDRISLDAIHDTIQNYRNHALIDGNQIAILGGSRGGELVLNLASKYTDFDAVIAIAPSNVSLPNQFGGFQKSSWTYKGEEIPYLRASSAAIKTIRKGDFYNGMVEILNNATAIQEAMIPVENIACPILIISAQNDEVWPSTKMSEMMIKRLHNNNFKYYYEHIEMNGGHAFTAHSETIILSFLNEHLKSEKTYRKQQNSRQIGFQWNEGQSEQVKIVDYH